MRPRAFLLLVLALFNLAALPAHAQRPTPSRATAERIAAARAAARRAAPPAEEPDWQARPALGTYTLAAGFTPDPYPVEVAVVGQDSTGVDGCPGFVAGARPDVNLDYRPTTGLPLRLFVRSATDTVLLLHTPAGEWVCSDDDEGSDPGIVFERPLGGSYSVWVGTYAAPVSDEDTGRRGVRSGTDTADDAPVDTVRATLYLTEISEPGAPEIGGAPTAGTLRLRAGFQPDPAVVAVVAGGPDVIAADVLGVAGCNGFVNGAAPTLNLTYTAADGLPLHFSARVRPTRRPDRRTGSDRLMDDEAELLPDSTRLLLLINTPDGEWACSTLPLLDAPDDEVLRGDGFGAEAFDEDALDGAAVDPRLTFEEPVAGLYSVWVGTVQSVAASARPAATLYVSELDAEALAARDEATRAAFSDSTGLLRLLSDDARADDASARDTEREELEAEGASRANRRDTAARTVEAADLDLFAAPTFGTVPLGREAEPASLLVAAGGPDRVGDVGPACAGFVTARAPTANVRLDAGGRALHLWVRAADDTTLLVNRPDGTWACSDDASATDADPALVLRTPESGLYNVWVGTYADSERVRATLQVSPRPPEE